MESRSRLDQSSSDEQLPFTIPTPTRPLQIRKEGEPVISKFIIMTSQMDSTKDSPTLGGESYAQDPRTQSPTRVRYQETQFLPPSSRGFSSAERSRYPSPTRDVDSSRSLASQSYQRGRHAHEYCSRANATTETAKDLYKERGQHPPRSSRSPTRAQLSQSSSLNPGGQKHRRSAGSDPSGIMGHFTPLNPTTLERDSRVSLGATYRSIIPNNPFKLEDTTSEILEEIDALGIISDYAQPQSPAPRTNDSKHSRQNHVNPVEDERFKTAAISRKPVLTPDQQLVPRPRLRRVESSPHLMQGAFTPVEKSQKMPRPISLDKSKDMYSNYRQASPSPTRERRVYLNRNKTLPTVRYSHDRSPVRSGYPTSGDSSPDPSTSGTNQFSNDEKYVATSFKTLFGAGGWLGSEDEFLVDREDRFLALDGDVHTTNDPRKKLFAEGGLLGMGGSPAETPRKAAMRKQSMLKKLKSKIGEVTQKADSTLAKESPSEQRGGSDLLTAPTFPISLPDLHQAKLYSILECLILRTGNQFLAREWEAGNVSNDSIKKTLASWKNKGRPPVLEFRYDQQTQIELVEANQNQLNFSVSAFDVERVILNWKSVAREMGIHTFCSPDAMIRRQLHHAWEVLEALGADRGSLGLLQVLQEEFNNVVIIERQHKEDAGEDVGSPSSKGKGRTSGSSSQSKGRMCSTSTGSRDGNTRTDLYQY